MTCHLVTQPEISRSVTQQQGTCLVALAGQPNMGKSTLFNLLTGLNQHVGNWPGKTVERRSGVFSCNGRSYQLVDLPGTYSLTANSPEELIAREFIMHEHPDVVVAMVSAANLERSLYLVAELVCLPAPVVVALNMMDVAEQEGLHVEAEVLSAALGLPVIPLTATRAAGVPELLHAVELTIQQKRLTNQSACVCGQLAICGTAAPCRQHLPGPRRPEIRHDHHQVLDQIQEYIYGYVPAPYPPDWIALKLLEGDAAITRQLASTLPPERWELVQMLLTAHDDALLAVAAGRYDWIERMVRAAVAQPRPGQVSLTSRIDRWATHPLWGLAVLAGVLGIVFWLTFTIGSPLQAWMDSQAITPLAQMMSGLLHTAPAWLSNLVADGIVGGVGSVLTFIPIMVIFFIAFALLEDIGYMARAAFVMDNFMHLMGLHGKSFLPLFLGFGCNVPAVVGTRVIDSWQARLLTILIAPLVPCTARMAVVVFLAPAFFGAHSALVTWGLIMGALLLLVLTGVLLNRAIFHGQRSAFIMELPLYHLPNLRTIGLLTWQRLLAFVKKAGTTILGLSVLVWIFSTLPGGALQTSYLAQLGRLAEPVGQWMGLDWQLTVALLTSFVAKENAIATLAVLFSSGQDTSLAQTLAATFSPASGLAFLTVSILFIPCAATVSVIRQETGSWRWTLLNIFLLLVISLVAGTLVYHLAVFFGL